MNDERRQAFEAEIARLQGLLVALDELSPSNDQGAARSAARELVQVVIGLHGQGLADLLGIVHEAGTQPADTLLPRFAVNPAVRGLLLLHGLHPEDLAGRARQAVERLRPHLGVKGVRADFVGVEDNVVRIAVTASGQHSNRPDVTALKREIEDTVWELIPDAADLVIDGLETTAGAREAYVSLAAISKARAAGERA